MRNTTTLLGFYDALRHRKNLNWFADKNCTRPTKVDFRHCDTLLKDGKFFNATCSEGLSNGDIVAYALRHLVKYNPVTQKMSAEVVALAPIFTRYNTKGQKYQHCLGWLKLPLSDKNTTENSAESIDFAFAKRTTLYIKNSDIQANSKAVTEPLSQTLFAAAQQQKQKTYQSYVPYPPISEKAFAEMQIKRLDTVVTYNPESYEESIKVIESEGIKSADICGLMYHLLYSFDEKTFKFTTKIENIGIEEEHKDKNGKFMYRNTAFCIKPE